MTRRYTTRRNTYITRARCQLRVLSIAARERQTEAKPKVDAKRARARARVRDGERKRERERDSPRSEFRVFSRARAHDSHEALLHTAVPPPCLCVGTGLR